MLFKIWKPSFYKGFVGTVVISHNLIQELRFNHFWVTKYGEIAHCVSPSDAMGMELIHEKP